MKLYKKGDDTTYTLGVFPTIELLKTKPQQVVRVVVHSSIEKNKGYPLIQKLCQQNHIPIDIHDKTIEKLSPKSNCFAIGVFKIYSDELMEGNHVVLVNPMDMGNIGTIMRTMLGFGYLNYRFETIRFKVEEFVPSLLDIFNEVDDSFVKLEGMMNNQRFEDAQQYTKEIEEKVYWIDQRLEDLPN